MDPRARKSPARFLAPLALIIALVAFMAIVTSSGGGGSTTSSDVTQSTTSAARSSTTAAKSTTTAAKKKAAGGKRFYTVQAGDTLGGIASKTGIPLATIQTLNPNVDPNAMTTGQKIRLK